jgi:hypothetical protein
MSRRRALTNRCTDLPSRHHSRGTREKRWLLFAFAAISLAYLPSVLADEPQSVSTDRPHGSALTPLMQLKLDKAKAILEGLTMENYDSVASNAKSLKLLSMEAGWNVMQTEEYATQSREFRRASDMIAEAALEKDISRATLGYVSLTTRCVECHTYMRKHRAKDTETKTGQ